MVMNLHNNAGAQETWVQSLGWEGPMKEEMATHSSILAWEIPWTEEPGGLQPMGLLRVRHDCVTSAQTSVMVKVSGNEEADSSTD